jgi:hypothetical protein
MLLACGWSNERIARCIVDPRTGKAISIPTLQRYFRCELSERVHARDRLVARQMEVAAVAAFEKGNVGAMRFFQQLLEKNDMMQAEALLGRPEATPPAEKLGKKEINEQLAEEADKSLMAELDAEAESGVRH